jgi:hypothetical protein
MAEAPDYGASSGQGYSDARVGHSVRAFYADDEDGEELPWQRDLHQNERREVRRASKGDVSDKLSVFYDDEDDLPGR